MKRCREQAQRLVKAMPSFHRRSTTMKSNILAAKKTALAVALATGFITTTTAPVQAGIPVIDGGNLAQNIMTAIESVAQTLKQIEDRKSTRLNSSHVAISYAVFCLKKKRNVTIRASLHEVTSGSR